MKKEKETAYVVWTNSDLTEGRGNNEVLAITEYESTATRIAKKNYVQGTDCPVEEVEIFKHNGNGRYYGPISFTQPTKEDKEKEIELQKERELKEKQEEILTKAKELGLSEEEILILKS